MEREWGSQTDVSYKEQERRVRRESDAKNIVANGGILKFFSQKAIIRHVLISEYTVHVVS